MKRLPSVLVSLLFFSLPMSNLSLAQAKNDSFVETCKQALAATLLRQIELAAAKMKSEYGPNVMAGGGPGELDSAHGRETLGEAWSRTLVGFGLPKTVAERENIAKILDLDPRASLVLAGPLARDEGIEYLTAALRKMAGAGK